MPALGEMQNITECKTYFVRINLGLSEAAAQDLDVGRTACESKGHVKTCVNEGHDRLAHGRGLHGDFELSMGYSYKLGFF